MHALLRTTHERTCVLLCNAPDPTENSDRRMPACTPHEYAVDERNVIRIDVLDRHHLNRFSVQSHSNETICSTCAEPHLGHRNLGQCLDSTIRHYCGCEYGFLGLSLLPVIQLGETASSSIGLYLCCSSRVQTST
ncbi:hypothetical protein IQ06DRAFT_75464 [Phaeosphaeriaceae sp. SRC1lsM3a]|nr:hypothetical protein IQ06DRAFT_75464 [Stagonospora sp. SRC1lsM3a]